MKYLLLPLALLAGCSTTAYEQYAKSTEAASVARSNALAEIAKSGDSSAKVAAVMALALGGGSQTQLQAPATNEALQWASVLVPGLTSVMGMRYNYLSQQNASNNATAVAVSTNETMLGIAGKIQAPVANITTTTTLSGTGNLGSGSYTTNANPVLSGTGTLGSGAYSTVDNHSVDNHTITPTPVTVIAPTVITPVTPTVPIVITPVTPTVPVVIVPPVTPIVPVIPTVPVIITPVVNTPTTVVCTVLAGVTSCN